MSQPTVNQCLKKVTEATTSMLLDQSEVFKTQVYFPRTIEELNVVMQN